MSKCTLTAKQIFPDHYHQNMCAYFGNRIKYFVSIKKDDAFYVRLSAVMKRVDVVAMLISQFMWIVLIYVVTAYRVFQKEKTEAKMDNTTAHV